MKRKKIFISYRNIKINDRYENYILLNKLVSVLKEENTSCEFLYLPPEMIPNGTLFSPYDIAEFIYKTFTLIDVCDKFIILDKDYFRENGELTSIWTEAEYCIWSYYGRTGFFNKYKTKDPFYTLAKPTETEFLFSQDPLYNLSKSQRTLLRTCALDFDHTAPHTVQYSLPYMKTLKHIMVVCSNCQKVYTVDSKKLRKLCNAQAKCVCGNRLKFKEEYMERKKYFVCLQELQSSEPKRINIFDALRLLFEKKSVYENLEIEEIKCE